MEAVQAAFCEKGWLPWLMGLVVKLRFGQGSRVGVQAVFCGSLRKPRPTFARGTGWKDRGSTIGRRSGSNIAEQVEPPGETLSGHMVEHTW